MTEPTLFTPHAVAALLLLALLPLALSACGGASSSAAGDANTSFSHVGNKAIRKFGAQLSGPQAHQVENALRSYLAARASAQWHKACSFLARATRRLLGHLAATSKQIEGRGCAGAIEWATQKLASAKRADLLEADVSSVRVEATRGYVIYADPAGAEYAMPIASEAGKWKLASVVGKPLGSAE